METEKHTLPIDAVVISLDETRHYSIADGHKKYIKAIRGVYLLDRHSVTHCCEITPSYWLLHLYDEAELTAEATDDESLRNGIFEAYESCGGDDIYVHCGAIDQIIADGKRWFVHVHGETGVSYDDTSYDEQMEALREHFNANHPF